MLVENEQIYCFDVDDTLVLWSDKFASPEPGTIPIVDPYDGLTVYLKPHVRHIKLLKQMAGRDRFVVVWSAAGAQWAQAVVNALELKPYVNLVMTKPVGYCDDIPVSEWMNNHIYIKPEDAA